MATSVARAVVAQLGPDYFAYQIPLGTSPVTGDDALASLDTRAQRFIGGMACGDELMFARKLGEGGEDATAYVIAKLEWAAGHPTSQGVTRIDGDCRFRRLIVPGDACPLFMSGCEDAVTLAAFAASSDWQGMKTGVFTPLNERLKSAAAPFCRGGPSRGYGIDGVIRRTVAFDPSDPANDGVWIDFVVDRECMLGQLNKSLELMTVVGQLGTGSPCNGDGLLWGDPATGDWDMTVKNLTRIVYLDARYGGGLLTPVVRTHVQHDLLTADGGPAEESYSLLGCGNTQESTGSSQDRADERSWTDDVGHFIDDVGGFLLKLLIILLIALVVAALLVATLGFGAAAAWIAVGAGVAAGIATAIALNTVIPETENHLLMINTSKYLKNQFIISDLGAGSDEAAPFESDQRQLRFWLLGRMQGFLTRDFIEYNARPYQRMSIVAILNIADFANDDDLRTGAQLVLDYTTAKFDVGSLQGRRLVPFRRLREALRDNLDVTATGFTGILDLANGGDHQVGLGLLYNGQTQQLRDGKASFGAASQVIYAATSTYHPESFVMDLAIRKGTVFQRLQHHETAETYSGGAGFMISAGGTQTGQAYTGSVSDGLDQAIQPKLKNDEGVALPTTLFLAGPDSTTYAQGFDRTTLADLIRIDGHRPDDTRFPSYDHNLCVWDGFACGTNIVIPKASFMTPAPTAMPCVSTMPASDGSTWDFIDTARCDAYKGGPRVFVAIYRHPCPSGAKDCDDNFGFFEVIDAKPQDVFATFTQKVRQANPVGFLSGTAGTYHSVRGYVIQFDANGHQNDDTHTGIVAVNGATQQRFANWSFAGGDPRIWAGTEAPIQSTGDGLVTLWNPRMGVRMDLDFRDVNHPVRKLR